MRAFAASLEDVFREAAARWTLVAYFTLSSLFILIFACAVNLDIVNGALAGAKIFGQAVDMGGQKVDLDKLVLGFESGFAGFLYLVGTFLALFATAHLVPRMQEKGTVDLYLSRPVSRRALLLSRYVAGLVLSATNLVYLLGAIWAIVALKTHVANARFFLAGGVILLAISALLAFAFLVGVVTSSTAVSIMAAYALFFLSALLAVHDKIAAAVSSEWAARTIHALYWALPKTAELGQAAVALVAGDEAPRRLAQALSPAPFLTTLAFTLVTLGLAVFLFRRKDF